MKKILKKIIFLYIAGILSIIGCNQRSIDPNDSNNNNSKRLVATVGTASSFDIATWNIENFPMKGPTTISYVAQLIKDLDIDLFGVEEIDDAASFYRLLDSLPDYNGVVSYYPTDYLKLGIIYKKDFISVSNVTQIFPNDYDFPRPPLVAYVQVKKENQVVFDFTIIVMHLKAFSDSTSEERRRRALEKLYSYINSNILNSADKDVIVLGDMNDEIDDPIGENVFQVFLDDTANYRFLTRSLIGQASYPGFNSLIDHLLISSDVLPEYGNGSIKIIDLDYQFSNYSTYVSDHRPVFAQFPVLNN
jgi:endonuclease/exonuclease/phosphatase family metal-dependent hydrolase